MPWYPSYRTVLEAKQTILRKFSNEKVHKNKTKLQSQDYCFGNIDTTSSCTLDRQDYLLQRFPGFETEQKMMKWTRSSKDGEVEERNRVSSYRGYLLKMRRSHNLLAPQWGKRWFSIEGRFLRWYRTDSDLNPSGMVNLKHVRNITKVEISGCFTFCVTSEDRNLILRASSLTEMSNWIRTLHIHADIARGGTGMNVVSDFNEVPLRASGLLTSKRGAKLRSSMTLQQELDLNLRKLDELEQQLVSQEKDKRRGDYDEPEHGDGRRSSATRWHDPDSRFRSADEGDSSPDLPVRHSSRIGAADNRPHGYRSVREDGPMDSSSTLTGANSIMKSGGAIVGHIESVDSMEDVTFSGVPIARSPRSRKVSGSGINSSAGPSNSGSVRERQQERDLSRSSASAGQLGVPARASQTQGTSGGLGLTPSRNRSTRHVAVDPDILHDASDDDGDDDEFDFDRSPRRAADKAQGGGRGGSDGQRHPASSSSAKRNQDDDYEIESLLSADTADKKPSPRLVDATVDSDARSRRFGSGHKRIPLTESLDSIDSVDLISFPKTSAVDAKGGKNKSSRSKGKSAGTSKDKALKKATSQDTESRSAHFTSGEVSLESRSRPHSALKSAWG